MIRNGTLRPREKRGRSAWKLSAEQSAGKRGKFDGNVRIFFCAKIPAACPYACGRDVRNGAFFRIGDGRMRGGRECRAAFAPGTRIVFRMKEGKGEKNKSNHPEREIN